MTAAPHRSALLDLDFGGAHRRKQQTGIRRCGQAACRAWLLRFAPAATICYVARAFALLGAVAVPDWGEKQTGAPPKDAPV